MSVYVDHARIPYRGMLMSHMLADSLDELHAMAEAIGLRRQWFQSKASHPHYDVCDAKRREAIKRGAVPASRRQIVDVMRRCRKVTP